MNPQDLLSALGKGSRFALSRILSLVEADTPQGRELLDALHAHTGRAHKIGITGPSGSGKSTLVSGMARALRQLPGHPRVAILAVDPTSPFTGGAILGDRVRMADLNGDEGVFIRSLATRGALGGLSDRTEALAQVFDAAGYDFILIETVGAGQSEVEIVKLAHTVIVVDVPGLGDDIQSIKAGILEIADVFVINKADHPGASESQHHLQTMIQLGFHAGDPQASHHGQRFAQSPAEPEENRTSANWVPAVLLTVANRSEGIDTLVTEVLAHAAWLRQTGTWQAKDEEAIRREIEKLLLAELWKNQIGLIPTAVFDEQIRLATERKCSPGQVVQYLLTYNC